MSFINKTIIVTGASSGIGAATAKQFISIGAKVILIARNKQKMEEIFSEYDSNKYRIYPFDLNDLDQINPFVSEIIRKEGPIDIVFNNAGISQFGYFEDSNLAVLEKIMKLDYFSVVAFTKAILPHMIEKKSGHIVTNSSVAGLIPSRNRTAYSSAKFALHGFFDSLRPEVARHNIHITLIAPGKVQTEIGKNALTETGDPYGKDDRGHAVGLSADAAAKKIISAIKRKKRQAIIAKWNDIAWLGLFLRKHFPWLYFELAKRIKA